MDWVGIMEIHCWLSLLGGMALGYAACLFDERAGSCGKPSPWPGGGDLD